MAASGANRPALAVTMGEPAGIGVDVTLAAWRNRQALNVGPFYLIAAPELVARRASRLGIDVPIVETGAEAAAEAFASALPMVPLRSSARGAAGAPDSADATAVIEAIETAVDHIHRGIASAVVTNPIQKKSLYDAGFRHPGHTEFLGALAERWDGGPWTPVMMLAGPDLRTVPVTVHIPLADVPRTLTRERIVTAGVIADRELRNRFGIDAPRLAVAGLNPHAGEGGSIGGEDDGIVAPAVAELAVRGIDARGPFPADTLFHAEARESYDVVLAMYHDQALIPVKTIAFDETVNVTLGLPFVRTSPDHGTALDIAGTGKARPTSLAAALRLAASMAAAEAG